MPKTSAAPNSPFVDLGYERLIARGNRQMQTILEAAVNLFTREGGAGFSARGVAKEAGLSLGSVQHVFRTKDELLTATLQARMSLYKRGLTQIGHKVPANPERRLKALLEYLVDDIWNPDTRKFFFNLYALSCHSRFAAAITRQCYTFHRQNFAAFIGAARPGLGRKACLAAALQMTSMIDGLMVSLEPGYDFHTRKADLYRLVSNALIQLIGPPVTLGSPRGRKGRVASRR